MQNVNGQIAKQWKELPIIKGQAVQIKVDPKYSDFVQRVSALISAYSKDIYGTADDQKYRNIVDLIIERLEDIVKENYTDLIDTELNDIILDIENNLIITNNIDNTKQIQTILDTIKQKIQEIINQFKNYIVNEFTDIFNTYNNSLQNKTNDKSKNDKLIEDNSSKDSKSEDKSEKTEETKEESEEKDESTDDNQNFEQFNVYLNSIFNSKTGIFAQITAFSYQFVKYEKTGFNFLSIIPTINNTFKLIYSKSFTPTQSNFEEIQNKLNNLQKTPKQKKQEKLFNEEIIKNKDVLSFLKKQINDIATIIFNSVGEILNKTIVVFSKILMKILLLLVIPFTLLLIEPLLLFIINPIMELLTPLSVKVIELIGSIVGIVNAFIVELITPMIKFVLETIGPPLKILITSFSDGIILILQTIEPHIIEFMKVLSDLVFIVFDMLNEFIMGINTRAKELGMAIADLIILVASKIIKLFEGFSTHVEAIGTKIGELVLQVFDIFKEFFLGIGDDAYNLGVAIGDFCEKLFDVLLGMFQGIENKAEQLGRDIALCISSLKIQMADILEALNAIVYKFIDILDSVIDFFVGIGTHAEKIGELYGLYLIEVAQIKRIILEQLASKAQNVGKYLASKVLKNFKKIYNYIIQIKDLCDPNKDDNENKELSKDFEIMTSAISVLKNIDQKLYDILPSSMSWDYGDYIDASRATFGRGIIKAMYGILSETEDLRTDIWKAISNSNINYKNEGFSESVKNAEELIKFLNGKHIISLYTKITDSVNKGIEFINNIKLQLTTLDDKYENIKLKTQQENSPSIEQQDIDKQTEEKNIENVIEKDGITSRFMNIFNVFSKIKKDNENIALEQQLNNSYDNIINSISEQISVPIFSINSLNNTYNTANMENLNA